tara:strand:+ start:66082 stop:67011 length:930 start_codon:yes stop_codon:yes gene_type:complete
LAKVTVIIPSYNHQNYIEQRLDSIQNQSYKDWEAIIIDDKSIDDSVCLIENYLKNNPDFKIKQFIKNDINSGSGYKSWQKGINLATTEYIWIAETDDYCESDFLETTVAALESHPKVALAFTGSNYVDTNGKFLYNSLKRFSKLNLKESGFKVFEEKVMKVDLPLNALITNGSSVVFRKSKAIIPDAIFNNKQISDLFLWTYILKDASFVCINKMLNSFRRHEASTTTINFAENNSKVYKEYVNYLNYFELDKSTSVKVQDHFIKHFLIPNRKKVGYFYTKPLEELKGFSKVTMRIQIIKAYINHTIKK